MRSFLGFVVFTAALIAVVAAFLVPPIVGPLVSSAVRAASPFGDQSLTIEVDVDALGLIRGFVGEIRISGSDLEADDARVGALDLTVQGVEVGDGHDFTDVRGSLDAVIVSRAGAPGIEVRSVTLSGPSTAVIATATLDAAQALLLVSDSLADAGIDADEVELVDGGVALVVSGQRVEVALAVLDGAIVAPILGRPPVPVLEPGPGDAWRITAVSVDPTSLVIEASVNAAGILASESAGRGQQSAWRPCAR